MVNNQAAPPKKKRGPKARGRVYYLEDFAGLWLFLEVRGEAVLIAHETLAAEKEKLKRMVDDGF